MADEGRIKKTRKDIGSVAKVPKGTIAPVRGFGLWEVLFILPSQTYRGRAREGERLSYICEANVSSHKLEGKLEGAKPLRKKKGKSIKTPR